MISQTSDDDRDAVTLHKIPSNWINDFSPRLLSVARRSVSLDVAEDLVQETLLTAIQKLHTFRGQGRFESWLFAILRRKKADYFRLLKRNRTVSGLTFQGDSESKLLEIATAKNTSPLEKMQLEELRQVLATGVALLSDHQYRILDHRLESRMSTKDLANHLDVSVQNLWTTLHRARKKLLNQINQYTSAS